MRWAFCGSAQKWHLLFLEVCKSFLFYKFLVGELDFSSSIYNTCVSVAVLSTDAKFYVSLIRWVREGYHSSRCYLKNTLFSNITFDGPWHKGSLSSCFASFNALKNNDIPWLTLFKALASAAWWNLVREGSIRLTYLSSFSELTCHFDGIASFAFGNDFYTVIFKKVASIWGELTRCAI